MGTVNFTGAGSGIDWNSLIDAQLQARTQQTIAPLEKWKASWESKLNAHTQLRDLLGDLRSAAGELDTADELRSYAASTTNEDVLGVAVTGDPNPGSHALEINQLAAAETEIHSGVDDTITVLNSSGAAQAFVYTYGGTTATVNVPNGTTLEQLAALINNDPGNPGVSASVLNDGTGSGTSHHLVLRGQEMGTDNTIVIEAGTSLAGDWASLTADAAAGSGSVTVDDAAGFSRYQAIVVGDEDSPGEYHIIDSIGGSSLNLQGTLADTFSTAQNAYVTPRGMGSALDGAATAGTSQITVADTSHFQVGNSVVIADGAGSEELTISEVDAAAGTVTFSSNLVNSYTAEAYVTQLEGGRKFTFGTNDFDEVQSARNAQFRVDGYPAGGWIERDSNVVEDVVEGLTLTLNGTTAGSPVSVNVNDDSEAVVEKIKGLVDAYNKVRTFLNQQTAYNPESDQAGALMGSYAVNLVESRLRNIIIGVLPGFQQGADEYTQVGQVGIEQVGTGEGSDLGSLTLDEDKLTAALTQDYDAVIRLFTDDYAGYSSSQYLSFYQASSLLTTPGQYDVEADFDGSGNLTAGRMKLATEATFRDATVDPPYLVGAEDSAEDGLYVRAEWDGASTTQTATVRVTQGLAPQMRDLVDEMLDSTDGLMRSVGESYQDVIGQIDDKISREQDRLESLRQYLTEKYARLEQYMVEMQGSQQWAQSMASSM